jgi:hypothetical protein
MVNFLTGTTSLHRPAENFGARTNPRKLQREPSPENPEMAANLKNFAANSPAGA